jgi:hypothetical protein
VAIGQNGVVMVSYQRWGVTNDIVVNVKLNFIGSFGDPIIVTTTNVTPPRVRIPAQNDRGIDAGGNLAWDLTTNRVYLGYLDSSSPSSPDTKVYIRYCGDYGQTWSPPIQVTDDPGSKSKFNPAIAVDQTTSRVALTWYDCRNSPDNNTAQIYGGMSNYTPISFSPNFMIAAQPSDGTNSPFGFNFGDYDTMDCYHGIMFRSWADNRSPLTPPYVGDGNQFNLATARVPL